MQKRRCCPCFRAPTGYLCADAAQSGSHRCVRCTRSRLQAPPRPWSLAAGLIDRDQCSSGRIGRHRAPANGIDVHEYRLPRQTATQFRPPSSFRISMFSVEQSSCGELRRFSFVKRLVQPLTSSVVNRNAIARRCLRDMQMGYSTNRRHARSGVTRPARTPSTKTYIRRRKW